MQTPFFSVYGGEVLGSAKDIQGQILDTHLSVNRQHAALLYMKGKMSRRWGVHASWGG